MSCLTKNHQSTATKNTSPKLCAFNRDGIGWLLNDNLLQFDIYYDYLDFLKSPGFGRVSWFTNVDIFFIKVFWFAAVVILNAENAASAQHLVQRNGDVLLRLEHLLLTQIYSASSQKIDTCTVNTNSETYNILPFLLHYLSSKLYLTSSMNVCIYCSHFV